MFNSEDLGLKAGGKITVRTLHGGRQEGVLEIVVDAGEMEFSVLPTRGMGIWWARHKGKSLFWKSPVREAVHPMYVVLERNGGLGWLDGFCEGVVRCGLGFNGAPGVDRIVDDRGNEVEIELPLHGHIANTPASEVTVVSMKDGTNSILSVSGIMYETSAQFDKYELKTRMDVEMGGNEIIIHDQVTNLSRERVAPLELLYHINVGGAVLSSGSRMIFKGNTRPRDKRAAEGFGEHTSMSGPRKGFIEQCYFIDLAERPNGQTGTMIVSAKGNFAVYELHNKKQLKCFTQWKQMGMDEYVNGLEPGTSLPNCRGEERKAGRLEFLQPQEKRIFDLVIGAIEKPSAIKKMARLLG